jgi:DNA repair exonuclease SbcCD ATPase subunit
MFIPQRRISFACVAMLATVACKDPQAKPSEAPAVEEMSIVVEADKTRILEEEQSLRKERASVEDEQARLALERSEISERLSTLSKKDKSQRDKLESDQKRLTDEENRLSARMRSFEDERDKLEKEKNKLLDKISKIETGVAPKGASVQQREEGIAKREQTIARREADVAQREKAVADRENEVAKALRDAQSLLSSAGSTRTIMVSAPAATPSSAPTGASVAAMRRDVTRKMEYRGLLTDDLPPTAREYDQDAKNALKQKDYGAAQDALVKLDKAIDGVVVNGAFVQGKMTRINRTYASTKLDNTRSTAMQKLLGEFTDLATDGRWDRANQKANQMVAVYQGK